jgi:hypothetical protein
MKNKIWMLKAIIVLQHQFVARLNVRTILLDLIIRTKNAVRDLDNINYRSSKLKKKNCVSDPYSFDTDPDPAF